MIVNRRRGIRQQYSCATDTSVLAILPLDIYSC
jgi:hypothetical protein